MAACANAMLELLALFEDAKAAGAVVCSSPDEDACTSEDEHALSAEADHVTACSAHADVRLGGGFNTNFTHSDILEPCTLIHFGWWEISIENQNVWGREILVSSIFVGLCSLSMCTYSDVVGVI